MNKSCLRKGMFRDLTRKKQKLSLEECKEILKQEVRGVLAVNGDDGYPYALPINFYFDERNNKIYFHSGKIGHRQDALKKHNKVSFCVYDKGYRNEDEWAFKVKSVIIFLNLSFINKLKSFNKLYLFVTIPTV